MEDFNPVWYTIPSFENIVPENPCHKEQVKMKPREFPGENLHVLARADFHVLKDKKNKKKYILRISGDDYYKLYINGSFAGQGPAPSWPEHYYYNEICGGLQHQVVLVSRGQKPLPFPATEAFDPGNIPATPY